MILEMRRALEELGKGKHQGYRKLYDATYEEVYCRSLLILQSEKQAADFMETFYAALFRCVGDLAVPEKPEHWFWQKYYHEMRKEYHHLLSAQGKGQHCGKSTLAAVPAALPFLHRILLMMSFRDEFSGKEIAGIFGIPEEKVGTELGKVKALLPNLTKHQPESAAAYTGDWRVLIAAAFHQVLTAESDQWVDSVYDHAADAADIKVGEASAKTDDFDYFVADVDVEPENPKKKKADPEALEDIVVSDDGDDGDDDDDVYDDDGDDEDDDDGEDDRYDWDLEDDNRKMVIIGVVLAVVIIAVAGFGIKTFLDKSKGSEAAVSTGQETGDSQESDAELVIRGDGDNSTDDSDSSSDDSSSDDSSSDDSSTDDSSGTGGQQTGEADASSGNTDGEGQTDEEASAEPETVTMKVSASSVNVRSEAGTDSSIVTKVKKGETVEVLGDASQEWVQVRCTDQDGKEGYVKSEFLTAAE